MEWRQQRPCLPSSTRNRRAKGTHPMDKAALQCEQRQVLRMGQDSECTSKGTKDQIKGGSQIPSTWSGMTGASVDTAASGSEKGLGRTSREQKPELRKQGSVPLSSTPSKFKARQGTGQGCRQTVERPVPRRATPWTCQNLCFLLV